MIWASFLTILGAGLSAFAIWSLFASFKAGVIAVGPFAFIAFSLFVFGAGAGTYVSYNRQLKKKQERFNKADLLAKFYNVKYKISKNSGEHYHGIEARDAEIQYFD